MKLVFHLFALVLFCTGVSAVETVEVSVKEGDSVTLNTDVQINQQDRIIWYYNGIRIAVINGYQRYFCTDVQCNEGTERFRDRLKLDHQTGSLTIMNFTNTDEGEYNLQMIIISISEKIFSVSVRRVFADEVSVMEGDSVTLNSDVTKQPHETMRWYFNNTRIAFINEDPSKSCLYDGEGGIFRDRLEVNYETGSLTITNIRSEHSGNYELEFIRSESQTLNQKGTCDRTKINRKTPNLGETIKTFRLIVTDPEEAYEDYADYYNFVSRLDFPDSGQSPVAKAGIIVVVAVAVIQLLV